MQFGNSTFNKKLSEKNGVIQLMMDLGDALSNPHTISLGGGNPAHIPEVENEIALWLEEMAQSPQRIRDSFGKYSSPIGDTGFREAYAELLNRSFGWNISKNNIALTNGSQSAFFAIFNSLSTLEKPIYCPFSPDYIGYRDLGVSGDLIESSKSRITKLNDCEFSYELSLPNDDQQYGALCVSSPCNPTGRCLTAEEISLLHQYCKKSNTPLIIDSAYGAPAPDIVFNHSSLPWLENTLYCFSLSKLGLPGARTGIVVGPEDWIENIAQLNGRMNLAPTNIGANLITPAINDGRLETLCENAIKPYYQSVLNTTLEILKTQKGDLPLRWHRVDGGFFVWLWFDINGFDDQTFYQNLKDNGVVVVPGSYFFSSRLENWQHSSQCVRISLGQPLSLIELGLERLFTTARQI